MRKIIGIIATLLLAFTLLPTKATHASDIENHLMVAELTYWANKDVILPDAKGNYNPNRAVTRGEFASYIARALNLPTNNSYTFSDVAANTDLANNISRAAAAGIVGGYTDGTFKPSTNISRQHMAAMLQRALSYENIKMDYSPLIFKDTAKIQSMFHPAVGVNVYYNIIAGAQTSKGLYFYPNNNATIAEAAAFLYRMQTTITKYSTADTDEPEEQPSTPPTGMYYIGSVSNGSIKKNPTLYLTFDQALTAYDSSSAIQLIFKDNRIIKMKNYGVATVANTSSAVDTASIYQSTDLKKQITYLAEGNEMAYIASNDQYTTVKVGDITGYVATNAIELLPYATLSERSHYFVNDGKLYHKIYNYVTKSYAGEYIIGAAPTFMKQGVNYYSLDGVQFKLLDGSIAGTHYPYYQFASVRKPTPYSAEELNTIIATLIKEREQTGLAKYANATTKSKLLNLGTYLKQVESQYNVNAFFILAASMHESDYGMSANAQTKNNIFGIRVFDSSPEMGEVYAQPQDSVKAFIERYMNLNYVPQSGSYSFGAVPGNKNTGINVFYASDPFWGSKIAGHLYRMDSRFGNKEYKTATIGMVLNNGTVNTRAEATTSSPIVFTYKEKLLGSKGLFGYPIAIVEEKKGEDGYIWYKVYADSNPPSQFVWIRSDLVKKISAY